MPIDVAKVSGTKIKVVFKQKRKCTSENPFDIHSKVFFLKKGFATVGQKEDHQYQSIAKRFMFGLIFICF